MTSTSHNLNKYNVLVLSFYDRVTFRTVCFRDKTQISEDFRAYRHGWHDLHTSASRNEQLSFQIKLLHMLSV